MDKYLKPPLTLAEGVEWLRKHNVLIEDKEVLSVERFLKAETTFRLMGIARSVEGKLAFEDLKKIYFFDRQLRNIFLEAFEIAEVQLRTSVVSALVSETGEGAFVYENPTIFDPRFRPLHAEWLKDFKDKVERRTQEGFVSYYKERYKDDFPRLPVWAMVELMTFCELVVFCRNLSALNKAKLSHNYCIPGQVLFSWFLTFADVRNACAHHRVLYNRKLNRPHSPLSGAWSNVSDDKTGAVLASLSEFLSIGCGIKDRNKEFLTHWRKRIAKLLDKNRSVPGLMSGYGLEDSFVLEQ